MLTSGAQCVPHSDFQGCYPNIVLGLGQHRRWPNPSSQHRRGETGRCSSVNQLECLACWNTVALFVGIQWPCLWEYSGLNSRTVLLDAGLANCQTVCANLTTNFDHCGSCGQACPVGYVCNGGTCQCPAGECFARQLAMVCPAVLALPVVVR